MFKKRLKKGMKKILFVCWFDIWGRMPGNEPDLTLAHLEIFAVNSYTEKPIWVYEPSWSETKKN